MEGDAAAPGKEVGRRLGRVELVPHGQGRVLEDVVRVGAVGEQRENVGVEPPLVLQEQAEEPLAPVGAGRLGLIRRKCGGYRVDVGKYGHGTGRRYETGRGFASVIN